MKNYFKIFAKILFLTSMIGLTGCPDNYTKQLNTKQINVQTQTNTKALLDVPIISQKPELKNGCEVTGLAMLLQYAGVHIDKMTLAEEIKKDKTPLTRNKLWKIEGWGDPNVGFVGDITGKEPGFCVYPGPMIDLMEKYLPGRSINLTNQKFESLLQRLNSKKPVVVWVTIHFKAPKKLKQWENNGNIIEATFEEHAVVLVGYDENYCYINNPYNKKKNQKIKKEKFKSVWEAMGSKAISYM